MTLKRKRGATPRRTDTLSFEMHSEVEPRPEIDLVGYGFRCWMHASTTGRSDSFEMCWNKYAWHLGTDAARKALTGLACWVEAMCDVATRPITVLPASCCGFGSDECLAISMIAAGQHQACPVMKACAFALLDTPALDKPLQTGLEFASTLGQVGVNLSADAIINATALVGGNQSAQRTELSH